MFRFSFCDLLLLFVCSYWGKKGMCMCLQLWIHCTMGVFIALRISEITKSKGPDFAQFWMKPSEAFGTGKKLPKDSGKHSHNIQLVPNIWSTSFHQPVKISNGSLAAVASFELVPKYISKVKVLSKYFILKQLFPCKMGAKEQISYLQLFIQVWLTVPLFRRPRSLFTNNWWHLGVCGYAGENEKQAKR